MFRTGLNGLGAAAHIVDAGDCGIYATVRAGRCGNLVAQRTRRKGKTLIHGHQVRVIIGSGEVLDLVARRPWREQLGIGTEGYCGQSNRANRGEKNSCFHFVVLFLGDASLRRRMVMLVVPHSGMNPANYSGALNGN